MTTHTKTSNSSRPLGKISLIILVALPLLLSGCGQKGKLYLPDQASNHAQQQA